MVIAHWHVPWFLDVLAILFHPSSAHVNDAQRDADELAECFTDRSLHLRTAAKQHDAERHDLRWLRSRRPSQTEIQRVARRRNLSKAFRKGIETLSISFR